MRLAVIILSYNTCELLRQCLRSVFASAALAAPTLQTDVLVVDNASPDNSATMVTKEFPQAHLLASSENLGYTGGNNVALRQLGFSVDAPAVAATIVPPLAENLPPDYVLLLNADTEVVGDALGQMVQVLADRPNVGACGARLQYGNGRFQHGAFRFPSLWQVLIDIFPLTGLPGLHRLQNSRLNGRYPQRSWRGTAPFPVDFVLGAALLVRGTAVQQVGGLDNEFFLYCEEMDWCLRLHEAGWSVLAAPAVQVIHYEGQSSKQVRWPAFERLWRSRFRFYQKHRRRYPWGYLLYVRFLVRAGLQLRSWRALRRFVKGRITGTELESELSAYATVGKL